MVGSLYKYVDHIHIYVLLDCLAYRKPLWLYSSHVVPTKCPHPVVDDRSLPQTHVFMAIEARCLSGKMLTSSYLQYRGVAIWQRTLQSDNNYCSEDHVLLNNEQSANTSEVSLKKVNEPKNYTKCHAR